MFFLPMSWGYLILQHYGWCVVIKTFRLYTHYEIINTVSFCSVSLFQLPLPVPDFQTPHPSTGASNITLNSRVTSTTMSDLRQRCHPAHIFILGLPPFPGPSSPLFSTRALFNELQLFRQWCKPALSFSFVASFLQRNPWGWPPLMLTVGFLAAEAGLLISPHHSSINFQVTFENQSWSYKTHLNQINIISYRQEIKNM